MPTPRDRRILEAIRTHVRLTGDQIRRLLFRKPDGLLVSSQAVNSRLRRLTDLGYLEPQVVNAGHGAGPYAYGLGPQGRLIFRHGRSPARPDRLGQVWHQLELAEFRVRLQRSLEVRRGVLVEWLGEGILRSLLAGKRAWPVPDALVHWRLRDREGSFLLEWDRGTESLAVLTAKLSRYAAYWRMRGHRELIPGLGLKPRLAIVVKSRERRGRLIRWLTEHHGRLHLSTVMVGVASEILKSPISHYWWRSDIGEGASLHQ